jgi:hypothetical protein
MLFHLLLTAHGPFGVPLAWLAGHKDVEDV